MIQADDFLSAARRRGFVFFTGVPCSFLTPLINRTISDPASHYVGAASEGEAVAIAAGAWLAGKDAVVMCQNSGLGNTINPLTSLNYPFRIPVLLVVTWRGQPGLRDEPQHELMGEVTGSLLDVIRVPHDAFPSNPGDIEAALERAAGSMAQTGLPFAMIMAKDSVAPEALDAQPLPELRPGVFTDYREAGDPPSRFSLLEELLGAAPETAAMIATTGKCGRELFTLDDRAQHLYQVGSMGGASAMGLGVALNVAAPVYVLDGDGAALMKMGNFATIGAYRPTNLVHLLFDNGVHDSTGGQATVSPGIDFPAVALACGYARTFAIDSRAGFARALKQVGEVAGESVGPTLIHARVRPGSIDNLGRPTIKPPEVARRFKDFLAGF